MEDRASVNEAEQKDLGNPSLRKVKFFLIIGM